MLDIDTKNCENYAHSKNKQNKVYIYKLKSLIDKVLELNLQKGELVYDKWIK